MSSKSSFYNSTGVTNTQSNAIDASVDNAEASATASENSANSASASASTATTKASEASTSASTATTKASEASTSAATATTKASEASTSAATATTKASESATSATASANSATAASTSASTATTKASEASSSASTALSHKNAAETAKTAAETAETNAETAETNAASSATSASASASSASTSASTATTKAGEASTSASIALTKAGEASTSASNASTAASTATTKANEASASATAAASSATAASASKDAALAALDSFDDRYLGVKSSNPSVDNDGNALVAGSLYFNSTDDTMKVYEGSTWVAAYASLSGAVLQTGSTMTGDLSFGDNDKAKFGAGSDLQIYHDGNDSKIIENGSGDLYIGGASNMRFVNSAVNATYAMFTEGGKVQLNYNDSKRFETTDLGIDVTGTVTSDGLTVERETALTYGSIDINGTNDSSIRMYNSAGTANFRKMDIRYSAATGYEGLYFRSINDANNDFNEIARFDTKTGDISFYEDTGTTAKFFWDASAESLGIGTSSPSATLQVVGTTNSLQSVFGSDSSGLKISTFQKTANDAGVILDAQESSNGTLTFATTGTERMRIDSSGNVGIGRTPTNTLNPSLEIKDGGSIFGYGDALYIASNLYYDGAWKAMATGAGAKYVSDSNGHRFYTSPSASAGGAVTPTERMRINSSGNVGIGTSSPSGSGLHIKKDTSATTNELLRLSNSAGSATDGVKLIMEVANTSGNGGEIGTVRDGGSFNPYMYFSTSAGISSSPVERMRIDSSGNLLVGKTSAGYNVDGFEAHPNGETYVSRSGTPMAINRNSSNGTFLNFYKDGSPVGSIGTNGSTLYIGSTEGADAHLGFGNQIIRPVTSSGASRDNAIDLGYNGMRFRDLYLSGTIEIENGSGNVSVGSKALYTNTATNNTAVGHQAGYSQTNGGHYNTYMGYRAGWRNTGGDFNTYYGYEAGFDNQGGTGNTYIGRSSGYYMNGGNYNTIIGGFDGNQNGLDIRTSSNNIVLSDGDGNPRITANSSGQVSVGDRVSYGDSGYTNTQFTVNANNTDHSAAFNTDTTTSAHAYGILVKYTNVAPNGGGNGFMYCSDSTGQKFRVLSNGNVQNTNNSYGAISDQILKENIVDSGSQWDDIKAVRVRKYSLIADDLDAPNQLGVIAQELETAGMNGLVDDVEVDKGSVETTKTVNYSILYMKAVKALQEAMARIETLETKVATLEG